MKVCHHLQTQVYAETLARTGEICFPLKKIYKFLLRRSLCARFIKANLGLSAIELTANNVKASLSLYVFWYFSRSLSCH